MKHSPSWEANSSSGGQEISRIIWDPKVHYHVHKILKLVSTNSQINPVHVLMIHSNIILLYKPILKVASFFHVSPPKSCMYFSSPTHTHARSVSSSLTSSYLLFLLFLLLLLLLLLLRCEMETNTRNLEQTTHWTFCLIHSLTLIHSHTHSFTHILIHTHSHTHSFTHTLTPVTGLPFTASHCNKTKLTATVPILRRIVRAATDNNRWQLRADYMEYFHLLSPRNANVAL